MESLRHSQGRPVSYGRGSCGSAQFRKARSVRTCAQPRTKVVELLVLLEARHGTSREDQTAMVEQLWSMQYATPGVVTACGGALTHPTLPLSAVELQGLQGGLAAQPNQTSKQGSRHTHGVHFRFSNQVQASAFLKHPSVKGLLTVNQPTAPPPGVPSDDLPQDAAPICVHTSVMTFQGSVESEMDALFRRGPDFETGYELVMTLRSTLPCVAVARGSTSGTGTGTGVPAGRRGGEPGGVMGGSGPEPAAPAAAPASKVQVMVTASTPDVVLREEDVVAHTTAVQEFLSELALLAQSSVAGAVQVSFGPILDMQPTTNLQPPTPQQQHQPNLSHSSCPPSSSSSSSSSPLGGPPVLNVHLSHGDRLVFMARFPSRQQLQAFRQSAPCVALWQQRAQLEREAAGKVLPLLPVCAEAETVMAVTPGEA